MRFLLPLAVLAVGCGFASNLLSSKDARCEMRPVEDQCTDIRDFKGPTFITFQGVCTTLIGAQDGGSYEENARCDVTGSIGGCQTANGDGSKQTNWYYGPKYKTEDDGRKECSSGQKFVAPEP